MFINTPLRDCKCGVFQDVQESLGIKGQWQSKNEAFPSVLGGCSCREGPFLLQRGPTFSAYL